MELLTECHNMYSRTCYRKSLCMTEVSTCWPIALLPIVDKFSNIVWTMNPKESSEFKSISEDDFLKAVNYALDYGYGPHLSSSLLGNADIFSWLKGDVSGVANDCFEIPPKAVKLASERMLFPLSLRHANDYASKRVVLIGDVGHTVHPLVGQGVNLGFGDASTLSSVVSEGIAVGTDIREAYSVDFGPPNILRAAAFHELTIFHHLKRASSLMPLGSKDCHCSLKDLDNYVSKS